MLPVSDLYACLSVKRTATPEQIQQAYRRAARRFHPDANPSPHASEEFKLIADAYDILGNPARRARYDSQFPAAARSFFSTKLMYSRAKLLRLPDSQIVYVFAEITAQSNAVIPEPPLNLCLVIDRSTSMQGARLEQVVSAGRQIINALSENDTFSVVTFSDHAEVVLPAQLCQNKAAIHSKVSSIYAGGGTEILQGLLAGLLELQHNLKPTAANHLILLTDGRTYGDEDNCFLLARLAASDGITISGLGIGDEWNDSFLDRLAAETGGQSVYISSPSVVTRLLTEQVRGIGDTLGRIRLDAICDPGVTLKSAFRVSPEAQPITSDSPLMNLGPLFKNGTVSVLLEFVVTTNADPYRALARLRVIGDILNTGNPGESEVVDIYLPQTDTPDPTPPPPTIVSALDRLTLYRLQEKAWSDADAGNITLATQRLQTVATRLLANGERELASIAMGEAARLNQTRQVSSENRKRIKYGTRALIPPSHS